MCLSTDFVCVCVPVCMYAFVHSGYSFSHLFPLPPPPKSYPCLTIGFNVCSLWCLLEILSRKQTPLFYDSMTLYSWRVAMVYRGSAWAMINHGCHLENVADSLHEQRPGPVPDARRARAGHHIIPIFERLLDVKLWRESISVWRIHDRVSYLPWWTWC